MIGHRALAMPPCDSSYPAQPLPDGGGVYTIPQPQAAEPAHPETP